MEQLVTDTMRQRGMGYTEALDEVIADGCEMLLRDSKALEKLAMENASLFVKVVTKVREFIANLRKAQTDMYGGNEELHDAALKLREELKSLEEVQEVFDNALENSIRNMRDALTEAENAKTRENLDVLEKQAEKEGLQLSEEIGDRYADYDKPITVYDVEVLRSIGRKSINSFTSEDIQKAAKWAYKFYKELGTKSPFFRAWFGDWRAKDRNGVKVVDTAGYTKGQKVYNEDTSWDINVNRQVGKETSNHRGKNEQSAVKYLPYIDDITKKAVLLGTESSDDSNVNSLFFHSMYAYTEVLGYPALLKLQVEELFYNSRDESGIIHRDYILQNIEEEQLPRSKQVSSLHHLENGSSTITVSDLYSFVKRFDKDFSAAHEVNPALLNEDGTPKVFYHGTRERFTVFDKTKRGSNTNTKISHNWFFAADKETANSYYPLGVMEYLYNKTNNESFNPTKLRENIRGNLYELYVSAKKPLVVDVANYDYTVHRENADAWTEYAELADKNGNDVIILLNAMDNQLKPKARESTVVLFRDSSQVKSATDNIGTFDKGYKDILYSEETETSRDTLVSDMEAVAETDEEKSFVEKLKSEVKKANALQKELAEVNRKIKEISFTKGADRSALPSLNEERERIAKKLNRLDSKFYGYRGYDTFKTLAERKSKEAVIAERLRGKEALRSQKQKYQEAAQGIKDTLAQREEDRRRREIVRGIAKRIDKIDSIAKADSKTKHIPSALRQIVRDFRAAVDTRTQNYDERIAKVNEAVKKLEEKRNKYDVGSAEYEELSAQIEKKLALAETYGMRGEKAEKYLDGILEYYKSYGDGKSGTYLVTDELTSIIEDMKSIVGERPLYMLSADELEIVLNATKAVQKQIATANKLFKSSKSVSDTVNIAASQTNDRRNSKAVKNPAIRKMLSAATDFFYYNNLKPYELFKITGSQEMYNLYRRLQRSEGDSARLITKYADKYRETAKKNGVKEGMFGEDTRITLDSGKTIVITRGEALTLHLTQRREQGRTHLLGEGFKPKDGIVRTVENGKVKTRSSADFITLTETDLSKFGEAAGKNLTAFGEEMQNYMSTEMSKDGNGVSMALYDVKLFGEKNYISLDVDQSSSFELASAIYGSSVANFRSQNVNRVY